MAPALATREWAVLYWANTLEGTMTKEQRRLDEARTEESPVEKMGSLFE